MADERGVWGIEIGQAGLKAVRVRFTEGAEQVVATAFDYIPHPKMLSQPDAIPEEIIPQALETFLSRNETEGDLISIALPGQTALARFIQLPPVESSKVADIVKYEARQQIPFALEDVIWDYQTLSGGVQESGYMLEAEVGLFAMKRDQVMYHMRPFLDAKLEVENVQIAPLALYNFLSYDRMGIRPDQESQGSDEYTILLDMGADNTTLLVTNGEKIWIRNVPIGGNHFTRALTKEMKLTFAKAEHLKCNATKSPDPRAVFQALRPVFNDYVSEIQRSIGYFSSVNRDAKIGRVIGLGNGFKLAGLQKFLQQNLQYDVERIEEFRSLAGDNVVHSPLFQEHILTFAVPYGLALQTLGLSRIGTSLLPPEIASARKIRRKKPIAVATAAGLLLGLSLSTAGYAFALSSVSEERFGDGERGMARLQRRVENDTAAYNTQTSRYESIKQNGHQLVQALDDRDYWFELYRAINAALPRDEGEELDENNILRRHRVHLRGITVDKQTPPEEWYETLPPHTKEFMHPDDRGATPSPNAYIVKLEGAHNHHESDDPHMQYMLYLKNTFLKNLQQFTIERNGETIPIRKQGITYATIRQSNSDGEIGLPAQLFSDEKTDPQFNVLEQPRGGFNDAQRGNRNQGRGAARLRGAIAGARPNAPQDFIQQPKVVTIPETTFTIEFLWYKMPEQEWPETPEDLAATLSQRREAAQAAREAAAAPAFEEFEEEDQSQWEGLIDR